MPMKRRPMANVPQQTRVNGKKMLSLKPLHWNTNLRNEKIG